MTSAVNYAILIALAIVIAAGASLIYVVYQHLAAPTPPTPTTTTTPTTPQTTTTTRSETTTPAASSRVLSVTMYVATPEVMKCGGLSDRYLYYFNVTVNRTRAEDPVTNYVFKAVAGNNTYPLTTASVMALEDKFFKKYDINATQKLGVVNIYLELESPNLLDINAVTYLDSVHNVDKKFYVACVKRIVFRGAYNHSMLGPGDLGLVPTDRQFTVNIFPPPGNYRISAPPGVVVTPWEIAGGNVTLTIGFLNQPHQAYDPLILNLTKIG
ncbi:MAG: hypothetical protein JHC20_05760 [Pyrobaculum sp.]|nr:hypothetical protein [Pyrobaculum sp.]